MFFTQRIQMLLFIPKESRPDEKRIAIVPSSVEKFKKLGATVTLQQGIGSHLHISDEQYIKAGGEVVLNTLAASQKADITLRLNPPLIQEISHLKPGSIHLSFMNPFQSQDLIQAFKQHHISALSMEMIPRSTIAQKMDALSSQASLAGYVAVLLAAQHSSKIYPMMVTPCGTIHASRVFVIGAGVAGLQAIATAKRLGARVDAFDTRPTVAEQIQSLGAKFVKVDLGETLQTADGYAKELTEEQLQKQRESMAKVCELADVVISTAQIFGKKAPLIITDDILKRMKPGSILVDLAVESGGNIEGSRPGEIVDKYGVKILGFCNLPGFVPLNASEMYSNNLTNFIEHFWDKEKKQFILDREHEIIQRCLITHAGNIL